MDLEKKIEQFEGTIGYLKITASKDNPAVKLGESMLQTLKELQKERELLMPIIGGAWDRRDAVGQGQFLNRINDLPDPLKQSCIQAYKERKNAEN